MSAILKRIDDPRSALDRTRRVDLVAYARDNNIPGIDENMPAILIRQRFKQRGIHRIPVASLQVLGQPSAAPPAPFPVAPGVAEPGVEVDALADLERQFASASSAPAAPPKPVAQMSINELGAEIKRLGIKRDRRDNMITMRAKIEAHGQNAT